MAYAILANDYSSHSVTKLELVDIIRVRLNTNDTFNIEIGEISKNDLQMEMQNILGLFLKLIFVKDIF